MLEGRLVRISGPIVQAEGLDGAGLYDVVEVGEARLVGEIIKLARGVATIQVYEENSGMRIGEPVRCEGRPFSLELGPGLIGEIYDGIQRPLREMHERDGAFLKPGAKMPGLGRERLWRFKPAVAVGDELKPGGLIGSVEETKLVEHRLLLAPDAPGGRVEWVAPEGDYRVDEAVARLEGGYEARLLQRWPARRPRPQARRLGMDKPLITGQRVIDVFFPIAKGGTAAIPGGFGTGKTMTQHAIAKWCDADIIVYIGCGERGNEMTDVLVEFPRLIDPRTGHSLMERTILIANTSNMPVAAREVSIYTGVTLAEYYRDMGYDVAIMADSTSRWAEALRELSGRLEEMPAEEGFPAYLPTRLAEFYERGGRVETLSGGEGSITIIGAVSPPGGDFSEPVTQHTKRFIRCFWALDRDLANARHYPAIGWIESYSDYTWDIEPWWKSINPDWLEARGKAMELLKREQKLEQIVRLIGPDALPDDQRLVLVTAELIKNGFLQQSSFDELDMFCEPDKQVRILKAIMRFHERALKIIKGGTPLHRILGLPCRDALARCKSTVANGDKAGLLEVEAAVERDFDRAEQAQREGRLL
jgi:V/A-type H+-transporting ATPase subunit A